MHKYVDLQGFKFDLSGLAYILPTDFKEIGEYFMRQLRELPSAEPEIIRCKDCDWWEKQKDSVQGRCALMQMYPAGGWFCGNARRRENNEA